MVLVLVTGVFEAGAAVGLAGFAAGDAAGLFEGLDAVTTGFLATDLAPALGADLALTLLAALGRPDFSAAAAGRSGRAVGEEADREGDGFSSARAPSVLPKPGLIFWGYVAII
jgi:hypothetical protein